MLCSAMATVSFNPKVADPMVLKATAIPWRHCESLTIEIKPSAAMATVRFNLKVADRNVVRATAIARRHFEN